MQRKLPITDCGLQIAEISQSLNLPMSKIIKLRIYPDPILRKKTEKVSRLNDEALRLIADLKTAVIQNHGLGLAANQIGATKAIFVINPTGVGTDEPPYAVINPEIVEISGSVEETEGCLSIPGISEVVSRPEKIIIIGLNEKGEKVKLSATGTLARAFCHEIDHLNGILFIDHLGKVRKELIEKRLKGVNR